MINFCTLGSSSSGNCHFLGTDRTKILIDAGFSGKKIQDLLGNIDVKGEELNGIFVTHEHTDHIRGVGILSRRFDIPIYANFKTWEAMREKIGPVKEKNINIIETGKNFIFRDIDISSTSIYHDAEDPIGYIFNKNNKKISLITDTGKIDERIMEDIEGSNLYLLESNHDVTMLHNGPYPYNVKERVLSELGHLSNVDTSKALSELIQAKGEVVLLGHISSNNNTHRTAFNETAFKLMELGIDIKKDIKLALTYKDRQTKLYEI